MKEIKVIRKYVNEGDEVILVEQLSFHTPSSYHRNDNVVCNFIKLFILHIENNHI